MSNRTKITVAAIANVSVAKVWGAWNTPADIIKWNFADPSWHCTASENNLSVGGKFKHRMEAKDGRFGFDFEGKYNKVEYLKEIVYTMPDGRSATTMFNEDEGKTHIYTTFDAETQNDPEFQKAGWQAILNNFVKYIESKS
ncbi:ATPase [Pseudoxanthomonas sp. SGD-10]|nr:ATPase [Pseudoxanthomonas sp. SGD-10]